MNEVSYYEISNALFASNILVSLMQYYILLYLTQSPSLPIGITFREGAGWVAAVGVDFLKQN